MAKVKAALSLLGELALLASFGALLLLGWQTYYTDFKAKQYQQRMLAGMDWVIDPNSFAPIVGASSGASEQAERGAPEVVGIAEHHKRSPHTLPSAKDGVFTSTADRAIAGGGAEGGTEATNGAFGAEKSGTPIAVLRVPSWGSAHGQVVHAGVTQSVLDQFGIGHFPETAPPGWQGNLALAGHRTTFGRPFAQLDQLSTADYLVLQTPANWFVYRFSHSEVVSARARYVLQPPATSGTALLTLVTCHPRHSYAQRLVAQAEMVYWAPVTAGVPLELLKPETS